MFLKRYILLCLKEDGRKLSRNSSGRLHFVLNIKYKKVLCIDNGNSDLVYYQIIHDIKFFISKLSEKRKKNRNRRRYSIGRNSN